MTIVESLWVAAAVLAVAATSAIAGRIRVAPPLILVALGVLASLTPFVPTLPQLAPELILTGVLPPLLYSAAVSMPTMEFRRDFGAISGLSILLVLLSSLAVGLVVWRLVPGIGFALALAVGAVVSPTDAVATSIVKRLGVPPRVTAVLDGESLLNDASALVLLRTAISAVGASVSVAGVLGEFAWSVLIAVVIGALVGIAYLRLGALVRSPAPHTAISFTVPFIASLPAEALGASGLLAAVVAGLVAGQGAARRFTPRVRLAEEQNWRTVELLLEGGLFLSMGLQLPQLMAHLGVADVFGALGLAAVALALTVAVRAGFVAPLLVWLASRRRQADRLKGSLDAVTARLAGERVADDAIDARTLRGVQRWAKVREPERFALRLRRVIADLDYYLAAPLGPREGAVVVWAGMRGAVTLAAAETLPTGPLRGVLVLVAFFVAAGSLLLQGGTLGWLVRRLGLRDPDSASAGSAALETALDETATAEISAAIGERGGDPERIATAMRRRGERMRERGGLSAGDFRAMRLRVIRAQRERLLAARDDGEFSSAALSRALTRLDADELSLELRGDD